MGSLSAGPALAVPGRTSKLSLFGTTQSLPLHSLHSHSHSHSHTTFTCTQFGASHSQGYCMRFNTCIHYRRSYSFCCPYIDRDRDRAKRSHTAMGHRFLNTSLRHVAARSDIVRGGTPHAASPFPETSFPPKARGACFYAITAIVSIFGFVLMLLSHPFVLLFDPYRRTAHYLVAKIWATLTIIPFFNLEFEGLEHLPPPNTPAVYVSNHQSFLDIYTLLTLGRSFKFISKTSIFLYPIIGWAMYLLGVIPLKRMDSRSQLDCLKQCIDLIRGGASVFFFPEGTRSKDGKLGAFKKGAFSVAVKTQVPVVPMTIIGTGSIMPAGQEGLLNPGSVKVVVHPCLMGNDAQVLCNQARSVISDTLEQKS